MQIPTSDTIFEVPQGLDHQYKISEMII